MNSKAMAARIAAIKQLKLDDDDRESPSSAGLMIDVPSFFLFSSGTASPVDIEPAADEKLISEERIVTAYQIGAARAPAKYVRARTERTHQSEPPQEKSGPSLEDRIKLAFNQLKSGNLVYRAPDHMKTSDHAVVSAAIATTDVAMHDLVSALAGNEGTLKTSVTKISPLMKMNLTSADFEVTSQSSQEQSVTEGFPSSWTWAIVPRHSGKAHLHLASVVVIRG